MASVSSRVVTLSGFIVLLALGGCGGSPSGSQAQDAIRAAIQMGDSTKLAASISIGSWKRAPGATDDTDLIADWTARVTFPEAYGYPVAKINGTQIVRVVVKPGGVVELAGQIKASKTSSNWLFDLPSGDPWQRYTALWSVPAGFDVINGTDVGWAKYVVQEGCPLMALSMFQNAVAEGSDEEKKLSAQVAQLRAQAQQAATQQQALTAQQNQAKREQAAQELRDQQAAKEAQVIGPWLAPFHSKDGDILTPAAGSAVGAVITSAKVDEAGGKVSGAGIDMSQMPFRSFTFEAAVTARPQAMQLTTSLAPEALKFYSLDKKGGVTAGSVDLTPLDETGRKHWDAIIALGQQLAAAPPLTLAAEMLSAADAANRQKTMQAAAIAGTLTVNGKKSTLYDGLFAGKADGRRVYEWKNTTIALRLDQPLTSKALYIEGSTAQSQPMKVVINGVHLIALPGLAKGAAASIALPADLQIMDLSFEAQGNVQTHGIMLIN